MYKNLRYKNKRQTRGVVSQFGVFFYTRMRMYGCANRRVYTRIYRYIDVAQKVFRMTKKLIWFLSVI